MVRVLVAGVLALLISIVLGPRFIDFLRRREYGQHIREEGPLHHSVKQGTPTMGGLLVIVAAAVAFLALTQYTTNALTVFLVTLGCAGIGFVDDFLSLRGKRSLGLPGRWKMLLLAGITVVVGIAAHHQHLSHKVLIPIVDYWLPLSYGWYVLLFLIVAGAANGVNLTDGVDGLAAGTGIITLMTFAAMAIGGALAGFAIMTKTELLLILIGGIFLIEAVSVMLQVFTFKYLGRRIFLMAPIHHHFEMKAWSETKIMVRFWILCGILCAAGFALYYRYYFRH